MNQGIPPTVVKDHTSTLTVPSAHITGRPSQEVRTLEELSTIFNNVGILVAALADGISLVMFGFAGTQYMTAQGDPQGMSRAKMSVIGAVVGLAIAGLAFVMPGIISRLIIEPAGGQYVAGDSVGDNCDQLLWSKLVFQRGASTADRIQEVIRQIQAQRDNCVSKLWDSEATGHGESDCLGTGTAPTYQNPLTAKIGDLTIPRGLYTGTVVGTSYVRNESGRDAENNIFVYWGHGGTDMTKRPADGSQCWLYVSGLNQWDENY